MVTSGHPEAKGNPTLLALSVIAAAGFWLLFVATLAPHEMMVGLFCVAATMVFTVFICRSAGMKITPRPRDLIQCWRVPWYIVSGVSEIVLILFKDLFHVEAAGDIYRVCGFDSSKSDPVRIARTVMAVAFTTTAPNFIVLGVDISQSRMIFHQIRSSSVPKMTKALGAKG